MLGFWPKQTTCSKKSKIPKFQDQYTISTALLMFKAFHERLPPNIQSSFSRVGQLRQTRQSVWNLSVEQRKTKIYNAKPSISGPYIWNNLPSNLKECGTFLSFKKNLKKYFHAKWTYPPTYHLWDRTLGFRQ